MGWIRASASPMHPNSQRLMSPQPNSVPRQRSPTPTFNARQLVESPVYNPSHQSPTPPLRRPPPTPTGFTTVYESTRSPSRPPPPHIVQQAFKPSTSANVYQPSDVSFPRPFRSTFSPTPSAPTPSSIPPFSPPPTPQYMYVDSDRQVKSMNEFYVVPLEPASQSRYVVYDDDESRPSTADIIAQQSQDYVDEKLAEYQATIMLLQGKSAKFRRKEKCGKLRQHSHGKKKFSARDTQMVIGPKRKDSLRLVKASGSSAFLLKCD